MDDVEKVVCHSHPLLLHGNRAEAPVSAVALPGGVLGPRPINSTEDLLLQHRIDAKTISKHLMKQKKRSNKSLVSSHCVLLRSPGLLRPMINQTNSIRGTAI
jgi:hypothetical protein